MAPNQENGGDWHGHNGKTMAIMGNVGFYREYFDQYCLTRIVRRFWISLPIARIVFAVSHLF